MAMRRAFPILLVLLQSGLAAGHAHTHLCLNNHTQRPHLHAHALFGDFAPEPIDHEPDDHDADAVDLSDMMVTATPPAFDTAALYALPLIGVQVCDGFTTLVVQLRLPPSTAGPPAPRYITFCTLTI